VVIIEYFEGLFEYLDLLLGERFLFAAVATLLALMGQVVVRGGYLLVGGNAEHFGGHFNEHVLLHFETAFHFELIMHT
jgi:hypothetical protein